MSDNTKASAKASVESQSETLGFESDVEQVLRLVTHNLYSNREIFLRELISNASDASDKLRFEALSDAALFENDPDLKIWIEFNKEHKTITIRDNGLGMTREDVIENLGSIARSGTKSFLDNLSKDQAKDSNLIGQFGVGFYSSFVVADKVTVRSRRAGMKADQGVCWESEGTGKYTVSNIEKASRGTEIILHLKKDCEEFADNFKIRGIITKYSDHILLPIDMLKIDAGMDTGSEADTDEKDKDKKKDKKAKAPEWETVNQATALWTLPKSKIKPEEYKELYKHISHDFEEPLAWAHNKVEGKTEYTSLLYLPSRAPFDMWNREMTRGLKLYVRRVFVMDDAEQFMPLYLRFVKGIVDSSDLPLNVSREILQSNKTIETIKGGCVKRILSMLEAMAKNDVEKYQKFWKEFGQVLKEGPAEDMPNKDRIAKLLRFASTHADKDEQNISFDAYIERMPKDQDKIYYLTADSFIAAKSSPLLEAFRSKGYEVLLMTDRVDEWLTSHLTEFDGKQLQSIAKGDIDLDDKDDKTKKEEKEKAAKDFEDSLKHIKEVLGDKVTDVRLTTRLTDSPCCVVYDENEMGGHLARLMAAAGQAAPESKPILELNASHHFVEQLKDNADSENVKNWAEFLLGQALLAEGETLSDPAAYVKLVNGMMR